MITSTLVLSMVLSLSQLVSIDSRDMDLTEFFRVMADAAKMNVVLHPAVQGKVNLMVKEASWEQVLDVVIKNHGLRKEVEGNVMRIAPASVFEAEYRQAAAIEEARMNALPLQTRVYFLNYAKAEDVALIISKGLSPRGSVVVYRPRNAVIVRDITAPEIPQ